MGGSGARVWVAFGLLSLAWGSSFLFIRIALDQLSPLALIALRLTIGAVGLSAFVLIRKQPLRVTPVQLGYLFLLATFNTSAPWFLTSWAEESIPSGLTSVLNSTTPIFSLLIAAAVLRDEPITFPRAIGVAVGFSGVVLLLSNTLFVKHVNWKSTLGEGAVILAALSYAVGTVLARRSLRNVPSLTIAFYGLGMAAVSAVLVSLAFSPPPVATLHLKTWLALLWLGLLGSALAYILFYFVLTNWGASRTTLVTYVLPVVGLTLGTIFLRESLGWRLLVGSVLVIGGVALASLARVSLRSRERSEARAPAG